MSINSVITRRGVKANLLRMETAYDPTSESTVTKVIETLPLSLVVIECVKNPSESSYKEVLKVLSTSAKRIDPQDKIETLGNQYDIGPLSPVYKGSRIECYELELRR
jgi:hypothetical protein